MRNQASTLHRAEARGQNRRTRRTKLILFAENSAPTPALRGTAKPSATEPCPDPRGGPEHSPEVSKKLKAAHTGVSESHAARPGRRRGVGSAPFRLTHGALRRPSVALRYPPQGLRLEPGHVHRVERSGMSRRMIGLPGRKPRHVMHLRQLEALDDSVR